eukprot:Sspe_Gene.101199::Locus_75793_Transcript_1_1_Confidence_1.000_Length_789::g.101199::m.101199
MYPMCEKCSVQDHCNNHAYNVDVVQDTCKCNCTGQYTGDHCDVCPPKYSGDFGYTCDECAAGRVNYPECKECTQSDCSGRALSITTDAAKTTCECECKHQWSGKDCSVCEERFEQTECDRCSTGFVNYPECTKCTVHEHCSGHAKGVTSNKNNTVCECDCEEGFTGGTCSQCAMGYVASYDDQLLAIASSSGGSSAWALQCRKCTVPHDCQGRATSVTSSDDHTQCICACNNKWVPPSCRDCPSIYDQTTCADCAAGRYGFP